MCWYSFAPSFFNCSRRCVNCISCAFFLLRTLNRVMILCEAFKRICHVAINNAFRVDSINKSNKHIASIKVINKSDRSHLMQFVIII